MPLIALLLLLPVIAGVAIFVAPTPAQRAQRIQIAAYGVGGLTLLLAALFFRTDAQWFTLPAAVAHSLDWLFLGGSIALSAWLLYACRRINRREWYIPVLIVIQTSVLLTAELGNTAPVVTHPLYLDSFSILMALIIGLVGGLICLHAIQYMRDYHAHDATISDRQPLFFLMLFVFLAAMFGIVFANQLTWLFFFWEITTLCSFWMISYSGTEEATRNGFRALGLNTIGGVAFALALLWLAHTPELHTWELNRLITDGGALALLPAALIGIAGLTKSAQLPFSSWLLGAMVAPTPVSALLHSSTMVKAGVFLLVKFAPVYHGSLVGVLIALIGAVTFLTTSLTAINQRNAKRVLAYSTIANLGLIVMCAGVGTAVTIWAAILLILFHAVAKGLLFLTVGTTEHLIGSRDIEDMEGLVYRQPLLAAMMIVGILGMFLAPFGMLIGKYTCFQAFLTLDVLPVAGILLAVILAFGSAPTLFFWSKWLGKLVALPRTEQVLIPVVPRSEAQVLIALTVTTYIACAVFPLVDWLFIQPYTGELMRTQLIPDVAQTLSWQTVGLMTAMLGGLFLLPLLFWLRPPTYTPVSGYLSGANVVGSASYRGAMGATRAVTSRGYYLTDVIDEIALMRAGSIAAILLTVFMLLGTTTL